MRSYQRLALVLVASFAASLLLAGCAAPPRTSANVATTNPRVVVEAAWTPWESDPLPHLAVTLTNEGFSAAAVGPSGTPLTVTGPSGIVPLFWGDPSFARSLAPGEAVVLVLHPRADANGTFGLALDHAWAKPMPAPLGTYFVCLGTTCAAARLGT